MVNEWLPELRIRARRPAKSRTSAPRLPQAEQTNRGSRSDSRTSSGLWSPLIALLSGCSGNPRNGSAATRTPMSRMSANVIFCGRSGMPHDSAEAGGKPLMGPATMGCCHTPAKPLTRKRRPARQAIGCGAKRLEWLKGVRENVSSK